MMLSQNTFDQRFPKEYVTEIHLRRTSNSANAYEVPKDG